MTSPLALIFYESLLTGNQLVNRLQDLGYRVVVVTDLGRLAEQAAEVKPLVCVVEFGALADRACAAVRSLHAAAPTTHVPVLGLYNFTGKKTDRTIADSAQAAGVTLLANERGFVAQLPELLQRVLEV